MRIAIASDHGGFDAKEQLRTWLEQAGHECVDFGCNSTDSVDYPDYAVPVAESVATGRCERGVLVCGTGIGMSIAANKVKGIRAAVVTEEFSVQATREHNDANILCLGARVVDEQKAVKLLDIFMDTPFSGEEKHKRRIGKLEQ